MANLIKHFTIVIYDSRVVLTRKLPIYDSRVINYDRKMFIRLATGRDGCVGLRASLHLRQSEFLLPQMVKNIQIQTLAGCCRHDKMFSRLHQSKTFTDRKYSKSNCFAFSVLQKLLFKGDHHSCMVLSAPTILRPWVQIPSIPSTLSSVCIVEVLIDIEMRKGQQ